MLKLSLEHKKPFSCELHINNKKQEISKNLHDIKSMKASDRAELLELMVTRKWGETK